MDFLGLEELEFMKKILFFINTLHGGGAEKVLVDLVNNMDPEKIPNYCADLDRCGCAQKVAQRSYPL